MTVQPIAPVIPSPGRLAGTPRTRPAAVRPLPLAGPAAALSVPAGVVYGTGSWHWGPMAGKYRAVRPLPLTVTSLSLGAED